MNKILVFLFLTIFSLGAVSQTIPTWKITDLEKYIANSEEPVVVNFWATYCAPCVKEIPYFQELVKKYEGKKVKLLLVSLDFKEFYPEKISSFAEKRSFTAPIVWLNETNADYFCPRIDESWSGVMPATLFVNNKTGFRSFYEEELPRKKVESELIKMTNSQ